MKQIETIRNASACHAFDYQSWIEKVLCAFVRYFFCVKKWDMIDGKHHGQKTVRPYLHKKVRTDV